MASNALKTSMTRMRQLFLLAIFSGLLTAPMAMAQQSQLQQQILAPDCSVPKSCTMKPPTITSIDEREGRPFIAGTYDGAFTKTLRATLGGRLYISSEDEELIVQGDEWRLDLGSLQVPLRAGTYELTIEAVGFVGDVKKTESSFVLSPKEVANAPVYRINTASPNMQTDGATTAQPDENLPLTEDQLQIPQPLDPTQDMPSSMLLPLVAVFIATIGGYGAFLAVRYFRASNK